MQELPLRHTISVQNDPVGFVTACTLVEHYQQLSRTHNKQI
jgi:hypothetical protein